MHEKCPHSASEDGQALANRTQGSQDRGSHASTPSMGATLAMSKCDSALTAVLNAPVLTWKLLVPNSFLLLVVRPGAPSSALAPSSDARSP